MKPCTYSTVGGFECGTVFKSDPYPEPCSFSKHSSDPVGERRKLGEDRSIFSYYVSPLLISSAIENNTEYLNDPEKQQGVACAPRK